MEEVTETTEAQDESREVESDDDKMVPLTQLLKERKQRTTLEKRLAQLEKAESERQKATLSETEKLAQERDEALRRTQELEQRVLRSERSTLVHAAASKAKFADPEDVVRFVDLNEVEDRHTAERLVNSLAKRKPYLLLQENTPTELQRVLQHGGGPSRRAGNEPLSEEEARSLQGEQVLDVVRAARARVGRPI